VGQKILVVEDNELNLKLFCDLLRAHGYETEPVRDGRDAVARAHAFAPDLVVMDIQMPYVSGLELIEQMKTDDGLRRTPIMAVTAYAAKGDEERIRDAGAEGYVSKPISVVKFVEAVAGLLAAAAARPPEPDAPAAEPIPTETPAEPGSEAAQARASEPVHDETPASAIEAGASSGQAEPAAELRKDAAGEAEEMGGTSARSRTKRQKPAPDSGPA
jgi:two-component system cell cycle response regulator DivK